MYILHCGICGFHEIHHNYSVVSPFYLVSMPWEVKITHRETEQISHRFNELGSYFLSENN